MRTLLVAALDGVVGQEPRIAAAAQPRPGLRPARHVRLILILHADGLPIDRRVAALAEMEDELVAIVEESLAVDGLVVADGQIVGETGAGSGQRLFDGDR